MVRRLALEKASDVAVRRRNGIVIGADTVVVLKDHVLGKPRNTGEAASMLRMLSGRSHSVYTGVALVDARSEQATTFYERTRVTFRTISATEIRKYVRSGSPLDKAGAYGIQDDFGAVFVEKVSGCFYTVVGFPLSRFTVELPRFERHILSSTKKVSRTWKRRSGSS